MLFCPFFQLVLAHFVRFSNNFAAKVLQILHICKRSCIFLLFSCISGLSESIEPLKIRGLAKLFFRFIAQVILMRGNINHK